MDIIITIPKTINWQQYKQQLKQAQNGDILNYKTTNFPKNTKKGDKCFICYQGYVIGFHFIVGFSEKSFTCNTTGKKWQGKFIQRTGKFHVIPKIKYQGFRGWRYFEYE